jgi:hypothetical protein
VSFHKGYNEKRHAQKCLIAAASEDKMQSATVRILAMAGGGALVLGLGLYRIVPRIHLRDHTPTHLWGLDIRISYAQLLDLA